MNIYSSDNMVYKNQNYMTNPVLKAQADRLQKGYVDPNTQEETFTPTTYSFISYADSEGETKWAEGTVETTGVTENGFTEVQVKTNTKEEFIGQKFYITSDAKTDGTIYPLYSDAGTTSVNIYVSISTQSE